MRVVIVAENASLRMSGESALQIYYFDLLRARGVDVWMVTHERSRDELRERYADEVFQRIHFVQDSRFQSRLYRWSQGLPFQIRDRIIGQWIHIISQKRMRPLVMRLIREFDLQLVFEPSPISPKAISYMYDLGVPVVIGPLCGGMEFPPAFQYLESSFNRISTQLGRITADILHQFIPGKLKAEVLLVANDRTAQALPRGCQGQIHHVIESGVDLAIWQPVPRPEPQPDQPVRFVYMARFVDQKGIPFLVEAFKRVADTTHSVLELIGDGELFEATQDQVAALNIQDQVVFHGRLPLKVAAQLISKCDVYVVPAIRDCGGCAMLEAMAMGVPVIAANWAGPGQYADETCGLRVDVTTRSGFIEGLSDAMIRLAQDPDLRRQLGEGSVQRVRSEYLDWDAKVDRVVEIFAEILAESPARVKVVS